MKVPDLADYLKALPWGVAFGASDDDEEEEGEEDDQEHVRLKRRVNRLLKQRGEKDLRIQDLSKESKKRRLRLREMTQELEELKSTGGTEAGEKLKRLKLQLRFVQAGHRMGMDDAAADDLFKLAYDELATAVDEDTGKVDKQKLSTLVESSLDKYPWAKADSSSNGKGDHDDDDGGSGAVDTTTGSNSRGKHSRPSSTADLTTRFPALAGRKK